MQALRVNSTLQGGKYRIIEKLGQGGFGITYLAEDTLLEGKVAIKEFFFKGYCDRDDSTSRVTIPTSGNREIVERFKQKFIKEARTIFRLNHPNIVRILGVFEENGTAYYVMDYIEGESLDDMVKRRGAIPEAEALGYVKDAASALGYIHSKNINHLDIKPGNLMKRKEDGRIIVIDFGVAKQYDLATSQGTTTTPVGISHGYSPLEQYGENGVQIFSPQSDVYALAATLFKLLTGNTPPEAIEILSEGLPVAELLEKHISRPVISAIAMAMKGRHERTQSVAEFISNLRNQDIEVPESTEVIPDPAEVERKLKESEEKVAKEKAEVERKLKEAEEKAAKEKAETERKLKEAKEKAAKEKAEVERKRKEAEEKAANEKAETERKLKEAKEKAAKEKAATERKRKEAEDNAAKERAETERKRKRKRKRLWMATFIVAIFVVAIFVVWQMAYSNNNKVEEDLPKETEASFSYGTLTVNGINYNMVWVEGSTLRMDTNKNQNRPNSGPSDGEPVHNETLSGYFIGETEVTQALWKAVMGSNPSGFKGDNLPVEMVSWDDCQEFISKLNSLTGQNFRLPTEAEWEFACRGGNNSRGYKYSGSNDIDSVAWYKDNSGGNTHPVATKLPNELGIYDMNGNVREWCSDRYGEFSSGTPSNPEVSYDASLYRVNRGGSWSDLAKYCRFSFRYGDNPDYRYDSVGLRLVL